MKASTLTNESKVAQGSNFIDLKTLLKLVALVALLFTLYLTGYLLAGCGAIILSYATYRSFLWMSDLMSIDLNFKSVDCSMQDMVSDLWD